jgi:hypothetical protein
MLKDILPPQAEVILMLKVKVLQQLEILLMQWD